MNMECLIFRDDYLTTLYLSLKRHNIPLDVCVRIADVEFPGHRPDKCNLSAEKARPSARTEALMARWIGRAASRKIS